MIPIAFFNNKGGVGKTTLVYHLAWTFVDIGFRVLVADFDPQSNLTALSVDEERLEQLWPERDELRPTVYGAIFPLIDASGDIADPRVEPLDARLGLLVGDIRLTDFEARLATSWGACLDRDRAAFRATTSFYRLILRASRSFDADVVLIDVGPSLGAITRAAVIAAEWLVTPLGADLFSVQALRNVGRSIGAWRTEWTERRERNPVKDLELPSGAMTPGGYVVMQPNLYGGRVTRAYERWLHRIPAEYDATLRARGRTADVPSIEDDPYNLGVLKHYRSLMPLAHAARKPIFHLRAADGALGAHATAALDAGRDFRRLALQIADRVGLQSGAY